jgi:hypothetical protein
MVASPSSRPDFSDRLYGGHIVTDGAVLDRPAYQVPDQSCDCHRGTTTEEHSTGSYYLVTAADIRANRTRYRQGDE